MQAFEVLGDPVRRRVLELIADGEVTSGEVCAVIRAEFGISQPAVSQHLRVLRDSGFATVRAAGTRRLYAVSPEPLREVAEWLDPFRRFWAPHLDALATELARGRRAGRLQQSTGPAGTPGAPARESTGPAGTPARESTGHTDDGSSA
jgi:DNA-binding transcriptional ArsR family regulator